MLPTKAPRKHSDGLMVHSLGRGGWALAPSDVVQRGSGCFLEGVLGGDLVSVGGLGEENFPNGFGPHPTRRKPESTKACAPPPSKKAFCAAATASDLHGLLRGPQRAGHLQSPDWPASGTLRASRSPQPSLHRGAYVLFVLFSGGPDQQALD